MKEKEFLHRATYCPEDNKIRFYPDWADPDFDKEAAKAVGYRWASKQECYVCPRWTPSAEDFAFNFVEEIEDEDYSPMERAADRAERFSGYRDKRASEAGIAADRFEDGPDVFGNQSAKRAERQANRHDRSRRFAVSQWSKAEYWQERTGGVISHALHKSDPSTRRGRILELEKEIRIRQEMHSPKPDASRYTDSDGVEYVWVGKGRGAYWRSVKKIEEYDPESDRWLKHWQMRLIYEKAMLENEGGRASDVEMIPGGWLGNRQILKVNKSTASGAVVSVQVLGTDWHGNANVPVTIDVTRLGEDVYRAPTADELAAFNEAQKLKPKAKGVVNPTMEDAKRLQDFWNAGTKFGKGTVREMTQAQYSRYSKSSDCWRTVTVFENGQGHFYYPSIRKLESEGVAIIGKIRVSAVIAGADNIVVLTDKPQKSLDIDWNAVESQLAEISAST